MYATSGNNAYKAALQPEIRICRNDLTYGVCGNTRSGGPVKTVSASGTRRIRIVKEDVKAMAASEHAIQKKYSRRRSAFCAVVILLISLTALTYIGILQRNAAILEMNYANVRIEREIKQIGVESGNIREEFVKVVDPVKLRQQAIEELGMREPASVQMMSVSVPNGDRIIYDAASPLNSGDNDIYGNLFEDLEGFFKTMR